MTLSEAKKNYNKVCNLVINKNIIESLESLKKLIEESGHGSFFDALEKNSETYKNILQHSFTNIKDPEKEYIYNHLRNAVLELADISMQKIYENKSGVDFYRKKQAYNSPHSTIKEEITEKIDKKLLNKEWAGIIDEEARKGGAEDHNLLVDELFEMLWLTDQYQEKDNELVNGIIITDALSWYEKCIMVSALTLSIQRFFHADKLNLLIGFYENGEHHVWQRALVGIVLVIYQYDKRLSLHKSLLTRLEALTDREDFEKNVELVIFQLIRAKETGRINKKLKDEILPEIQKLRPRIEEKLNMDNIIADTAGDDKNPEWESFFEDSPELFQKLEEFSKLQMEGSDVFMGAFSMLKRFSFFEKVQHWFLPFYPGNEISQNISGDKEGLQGTGVFVEALAKAPFLCNSDKYSFCLNVQQMPETQKSQMTELFKMEMDGMNELASEDEKIAPHLKDKYIIAQYIQDMYRFHKVFSLKNEFYSIFETNIDVYNAQNIMMLIKNSKVMRNIGEFYFEKQFFDEAINVFLDIIDKEKDNKEVIEKVAYCYQQKYEYPKALEYYLQVELIEANKPWIIKKIAFCYRKIGDINKSLEYYSEAAKLEPDNLYVQAYIGHNYLDQGEYEKALKHYYKVEYQAPDNTRILRPIGWCSFVLGKFDNAKKYFNKLLSEKIHNKYDYMNLAHVEWCTGDADNAIQHYLQSIHQKDNDFSQFRKDYLDDAVHLIQYGIDQLDVDLMLDNLRLKNKNNPADTS